MADHLFDPWFEAHRSVIDEEGELSLGYDSLTIIENSPVCSTIEMFSYFVIAIVAATATTYLKGFKSSELNWNLARP
ncbi:hypothetical protein DOY81_009338 [Sarcophaga bullata]|nr:hypothetical protein DOY81_009338 [Sarcophaga bullata]